MPLTDEVREELRDFRLARAQTFLSLSQLILHLEEELLRQLKWAIAARMIAARRLRSRVTVGLLSSSENIAVEVRAG